MADRIHVSMELDVFVDDEQAMRQSAFERMRAAWSSDDDFPFESADDVPLGRVVQSVLAAALPLEITGGRRSQLAIETDEPVSDDSDDDDDSDDSDDDDDSEDSGSDGDTDNDNADESSDDTSDDGANDESAEQKSD